MREGKPLSLLVRNLRYTTSPDRVRKYFEQFGEVRDVYLPLDYYTKLPRGFGFVEFSRDEDAEAALQSLSRHAVLDGAEVSVTVAQQGRKSPETMRHRERVPGRYRGDYRNGRHHHRGRSRSFSGDRRRYASRSRSYDRRRRRDSSYEFRRYHHRSSPGRYRCRDDSDDHHESSKRGGRRDSRSRSYEPSMRDDSRRSGGGAPDNNHAETNSNRRDDDGGSPGRHRHHHHHHHHREGSFEDERPQSHCSRNGSVPKRAGSPRSESPERRVHDDSNVQRRSRSPEQ